MGSNLSHENYLEYKNQGLSRLKISEIFGVTENQLKKIIAKNGWGAKKPNISNESCFDDYSEESCYWAGFIAADGCVDAKNRLRVMLNYDDLAHLEKLRKFLGSTHKISENTDKYYRASLEVTSPHIVDVLELNFNVVPNKTDKYILPKMPDIFFKHFLRGYFDGDGCICESFSNKNSVTATLYTTFASGSSVFSEQLFEKLKSTLGLGGSLQKFSDSNKWQLKYNTNDSITLLTYMYSNSIVYLDRKFAIYHRTVILKDREKR